MAQRLVVHVVFKAHYVFGVLNYGRLVVDVEREGLHLLLTLAPVVFGAGGERSGVLRVVLQPHFVGLNGDLGIRRAGLVGFCHLIDRVFVYDFAGDAVFYVYIHRFHRAQHAEVDGVEFVYAVVAVADGDFIDHRFDAAVGSAFDVVDVLTEGDICFGALVVPAYDDCLVQGGDGLVLVLDGGVVVVGADFVSSLVEDGGIQPVAVVCKIGYGEVYALPVGGVEGDEAFDVHAVFKVGVEVVLVRARELYRDGYNHVAVGAHGNFAVGVLYAVDIVGGLCVVEHVCLFGNGYAVYGHALGHDHCAEVVSPRLVGHVLYVELHGIDAAPRRVVAQLELGHGAAFDVEVYGAGYRLGYVAQTRALPSHGVGQSPFIVYYSGGAHQQLVYAVGEFNAFETVFAVDVLAQQRHGARHVGRRHRSAAVYAVAADDRRGYLAAVRRYFGLYL